MNRPRYYKQLAYALIFILISANHAVLASVMLHETQEHDSIEIIMAAQVNEDHQTPNTEISSTGSHDQQNHSDCDGSGNCNHCVNFVNSSLSNNVHQLSEFTPGSFATFSDTFLPSDIRPPKHI